ncbi:MAG: DUF2806 domain-containing protein [bacterium]|nr:DUF2806 domain-containing protein [bacterium]
MEWIPAAGKIIEYAVSGIGSVAGPMLSSWKARKEANAKMIEARGEAEVLAVRAEAQSRALSILTSGHEEARKLVESDSQIMQTELNIGEIIDQKVLFQEERRCRNISSVVQKSLDLVVDEEVSDHEPDHDWTARFFNYVQDVSSEEMQLLWAKVLAGEADRQGSTSIRSLAILRDLNKRTADLFRRLVSLPVSLGQDGHFLDSRAPSLHGNAGSNSLREYGLSFDQLNVLNEHGLIIADYNSWFDYQLCIGLKVPDLPGQIARLPFTYQGEKWVLDAAEQQERSQEFKLHGVALTESGRELARVVDLESVPAYDTALKSYFESKGLVMTRVVGS